MPNTKPTVYVAINGDEGQLTITGPLALLEKLIEVLYPTRRQDRDEKEQRMHRDNLAE